MHPTKCFVIKNEWKCNSVNGPCPKCGNTEFGFWTSASTGKQYRYCLPCRRTRAAIYTDRKFTNGGHHTRQQWLSKLAEFTQCPGCGRSWNNIPTRPNRRYKYVWTKDHIIPLSDGGTDDIENIQPLCYQCNSSKCDGERRSRRIVKIF